MARRLRSPRRLSSGLRSRGLRSDRAAPALSAPVIDPAYERSAIESGVFVAEYGVRVPWGISCDELFALIPPHAFSGCRRQRPCRCWPRLRCTVLGVKARYGFNFVSRDGTLRELQLHRRTPSPRRLRQTLALQRRYLGSPNRLDFADSHAWLLGRILVENNIHAFWRHPQPRRQWAHTISIFQRDPPDALEPG